MESPLVSITSAFYNTGILMLDMIKSVFAQTYSQWELILLDDGSTDNSLEIARSIVDPRVKIFTNGQNKGRAYSLNRLTGLSNGKYIARMDSDDLCSPTRIEKQVALLESNPKLDAVSTGLIYLDKWDNPIGDMISPTEHKEICATPWRTIHVAHGALMAKKEYFQKTPYREDIPIAIDFNMFFRSYQYSTFSNIPEPLYYYRLDNSFKLKKNYAARRVAAGFLFEEYRRDKQILKGLQYATYQYLKFVATVLCFGTGLRKRLMAKRFLQLNEQKTNVYLDEIKKIKSTGLPLKKELLSNVKAL